MAQPPTAAIVVAGIFLGLGTLYVSYRLYLKIYHRGVRRLAEQQLANDIAAKSASAAASASAWSTAGAPPPIATASLAKFPPASLANRPSYHHPMHFYHSQQRLVPPTPPYAAPATGSGSPFDSSSQLPSPASDPNCSPPLQDAPPPPPPPLAEPSPAFSSRTATGAGAGAYPSPARSASPAPLGHPLVAFGSNTSTSAIQRQYAAARQYGTSPNGTLTPSALAALSNAHGGATGGGSGSVYGGSDHGTGSIAGHTTIGNGTTGGAGSSSMSILGGVGGGAGATGSTSAGGPRTKRETYLPHLNRDMQIVTPSPLGFGLGGMATATDQRTLAFSKASGIGDNASLLSDPLLSSTLSLSGAEVGSLGGGGATARGGSHQHQGAGGGAEWEQRIQAYRTAGAGTGADTHAKHPSISSQSQSQSATPTPTPTSTAPGPGPSTNTPAAEYLAQQQHQLRLNQPSRSTSGGGD